MFSDCQAVVDVMASSACRGLDVRQIWAGAYRIAHSMPAGPALMRGIVKVPAHTCAREGEPLQDRLRRLGNDRADWYAKMAVSLHPSLHPVQRQMVAAQEADAKVTCKLLGIASAQWPAASAMVKESRRPPTRGGRSQQVEANQVRRQERRHERQREQHAAQATHSWVDVSTSRARSRGINVHSSGLPSAPANVDRTAASAAARRCAVCCQWFAQDVPPCAGPPAGWSEWREQATARGHAVRSALLFDEEGQQHVPLVFCSTCGAWTTTGAQVAGSLFMRPCRAPTKAGKQVLSRLCRGLHPKSGHNPPYASLAVRQE